MSVLFTSPQQAIPALLNDGRECDEVAVNPDVQRWCCAGCY